jgi:hypothetical protein
VCVCVCVCVCACVRACVCAYVRASLCSKFTLDEKKKRGKIQAKTPRKQYQQRLCFFILRLVFKANFFQLIFMSPGMSWDESDRFGTLCFRSCSAALFAAAAASCSFASAVSICTFVLVKLATRSVFVLAPPPSSPPPLPPALSPLQSVFVLLYW